MKRILTDKLDYVGFYTGMICAIHCSVIPLLAIFGLFSGLAWSHSLGFEIFFLLISLSIAGISLIRGFVVFHNNVSPILLGLIGFTMFVAGISFSSSLEILLTSLGALCIAISHVVNFRLIRCLR